MSIVVENLLKLYGAQKAVNDVSFTVNKGEIVGFLGPNGAGKSTTMKMITGFVKPDKGAISVNGINALTDLEATKKQIGYLPESNALYYDMYVKEYLAFVANMYKLTGDTRKTVDEVIERVGLTLEYKKKIGQLSKGYKQRVGLAGAIIHKPNVLILDEPTSGLDPNQIIEIREVIKEVGKDKTVLFSSHILQEVEAICNKVIIINRGDLLANDSLDNLLKNKKQQQLIVSFNKPLQKEWFVGIDDLSFTNASTLSYGGKNGEAVKKQLMQIALDKDLVIASMQNQTQNLEEVFRSFTQKK
jgi:ABC-2 type transport system ATP-binding protein